MLDKLKQLNELRKIQDELGQEKMEVEKNGIKVTINGKMEVESVVLNTDLSKEEQENLVKDCINEATRKMQKVAAQKMFKM